MSLRSQRHSATATSAKADTPVAIATQVSAKRQVLVKGETRIRGHPVAYGAHPLKRVPVFF